MIDTRAIRMRWEVDGSKRDERGQRLFAASEARAAGWGGVTAVAKITGVSRKRITAGLKDLAAPPLDPGRVRRKGLPFKGTTRKRKTQPETEANCNDRGRSGRGRTCCPGAGARTGACS
jgi:hypothetical protein